MLPRSLFSSSTVHEDISSDIKLDDCDEFSEEADNEDTILNETRPTDSVNETEKIVDKSYIYIASDMLQENISTVPDNVDSVVILIYRVNTEGKIPFLEFGLQSNPVTRDCFFIEISRDNLHMFYNYTIVKGHFTYQNVSYVFVDISGLAVSSDINSMFTTITNPIQYVVVDEVMNTHTIYDYNICNKVTNFFADNRHFLFLHDKNYNIYETPTIGYSRVDRSNADFTMVFGIDRCENKSPFGSGFYFTNYYNIMKNVEESNLNYLFPVFTNSSGNTHGHFVCRFLVFLGKMKVIMNHPDDPVDESDMKTSLLSNSETRNRAKMTMRITDHNALWQDSYDSVYVGKIKLDDDSNLNLGPLWAVKEHNQQMCLEYRLV